MISPAGGWKWIPFGAGSRKLCGLDARNSLGDAPKARPNARVNASSEP